VATLPAHPVAWTLWGQCLGQDGDHDGARAALWRSLICGFSEQAAALLGIALAFAGSGRLTAGHLAPARRAWRTGLVMDPASPIHLDGLAATDIVATGGVSSLWHTRLSMAAPGLPMAQPLVSALVARGQSGHALSRLRATVAMAPGQVEPLMALGAALASVGRFAEAAVIAARTIKLAHDNSQAHANAAVILLELGRSDEAERAARRAVALDPASIGARQNLGVVKERRRAFAGSMDDARRCLILEPGHTAATGNLAFLMLRSGDFAGGWSLLDAGARQRDQRFAGHEFWHGQDIAGRTILVHDEPDFGDTIQLVRCLRSLAGRGARVVLEVQPPLRRLFEGIAGADAVMARGEALPAFDVHCPLLSLPARLGITLETIPPGPCLRPPASRSERWEQAMAGHRGPRVGLVWAGRPNPTFDRRRSLTPLAMAPLMAASGAVFFSLQMSAATAGPHPALPGLVDLMSGVEDFADTAAMITHLDLVIGVDTAVVHLAAAMGKPVWLLSRFDGCWRWLDGRSDSPWYPTLRLFCQHTPGDWSLTLATVADALARRFPARGATQQG
jgi:tetratricopeptide (TPR) repeat protein